MRIAPLIVGLCVLGLAACGSRPPPPPKAQPAPQPAPVMVPTPTLPKTPEAPPPETGPLSEAESDIGRTFDSAVVVMPGPRGGAALVTRMGSPELSQYFARDGRRTYATVLYLHGCDGLSGLTPLRAMARRGFAVIAPDSFARRYRPRQCNPRTRTGGRNLYVYDFRAAELAYALHRMRRLRWVDQRRLFLVGVSEGGLAAAHYKGNDFRARVIAEWTCNGAPIVRGLDAPLDEPVLAVVRANDPWYRGSARRGGQRGDCGQYFGLRPRSRSLVLRQGQGHNVMGDRQGIAAILEFLSAEAQRAGFRGS